MPIALWTLLWLNFRAFLRRIGRQLRTVRGILFFIVGLGVISLWLGPSIWLNAHVTQIREQRTMAYAPVGILLMCIMNVFNSAGERAVTFTPAEVDFLFPGPFTRRSLLIYKLTKTALATTISSLLFGVLLGRYGGIFVYRFMGVWLLFQFMQLLAMTLANVQAIIGERLMSAGRWWIFIAIIAGCGLAVVEVYFSHREVSFAHLAQLKDTRVGRVVLAPFAVFARALLARRLFPDFLKWAAIAACMDLMMAALIMGLDANYLETSATISAKRYDRISRMRRSGLVGMAKPGTARWKIAMFPWAMGVGPVAWRQLTTAIRTSRTALIIMAIVGVGAGVALSKTPDPRASLGILAGLVVYLNLILSQMFKFDFRGDLDHLDVLRSLPLPRIAVTAAQLVAPSILMTMVQFLLLATAALAGHFPLPFLLSMAVLVIPLSILTFAADNLMFLIFPARPANAVAGDMGMVGRQTIVFACRSLLLLLVAAVCGGAGVGVWFLTKQSLPAAMIATMIPLIAAIGMMIWLISIAFERFDPSVNTPT